MYNNYHNFNNNYYNYNYNDHKNKIDEFNKMFKRVDEWLGSCLIIHDIEEFFENSTDRNEYFKNNILKTIDELSSKLVKLENNMKGYKKYIENQDNFRIPTNEKIQEWLDIFKAIGCCHILKPTQERKHYIIRGYSEHGKIAKEFGVNFEALENMGWEVDFGLECHATTGELNKIRQKIRQYLFNKNNNYYPNYHQNNYQRSNVFANNAQRNMFGNNNMNINNQNYGRLLYNNRNYNQNQYYYPN